MIDVSRETFSMTDAEFQEASARLGVSLSGPQIQSIATYEQLLASWSRRVRLVSRGDIDQLRERHILDSLSAVPFLEPGPLLDLGSGGGLPGLPIAIAERERPVHLVDSARMKCLFLRHVVEEVELMNTEVSHVRVESLQEEEGYCGTFGVVTARAVTDLDRLWEWSYPLLRQDGILLAFKGPGEIEQWGSAEGWSQAAEVSVDVVEVEPSGRKRAIVRIRKG